MSNYRIVSYGACVAAFLTQIVCMFVSASGMYVPTVIATVAAIFFITAGFCFGILDRQETEEQENARLSAAGSREWLNDAIEALDRLERDDTAENRTDFQQKATRALMALGEIHVSQKDLAVVAAAKAIEAQEALRHACESGDEAQIPVLRIRSEEMAKIAIHEIRRITK